jgi:osmotically-inducible protein OsmY
MTRDTQLQQAVLAELAWEPSIVAAHIGVTANDGVVTLTGHVEAYAQKHAAEMAAARVWGVKAVAEDIEVQLPFERTRGDEDIAAAALERLAWNSSLPQDAVTVTVAQGWVTLNGHVGRHYQKDAAGHDVGKLHGVTGVSNLIAVTSVAGVPDRGDGIRQALHRSWLLEHEHVTATADDGHVQLGGTVGSLYLRRMAEATAWAAPGITSVENNITVR